MTTLEMAPPAGKTSGTTQSVTLRIWRGDARGGKFEDYATPVTEGMVVLDAVHQVQATQANDLAVRWNCKAGKCGSCSAEVNGRPRLMCMTRMSVFTPEETITVTVSSSVKTDIRVMHISRGRPLISAEQDPHLPALQFQRTARSPAWVACTSRTASSTTMPSAASIR